MTPSDHSPSAEGYREAVARIIDPLAAKLRAELERTKTLPPKDRPPEKLWAEAYRNCAAREALALTKADQIAALPSQAVEPETRASGPKTQGVIERDGYFFRVTWVKFGVERTARIYEPQGMAASPALADALVLALEAHVLPSQAVEGEPVAWRYRHVRDDGKVHWTLTQKRMNSTPSAPGWCEIIVQPLYASPAPPQPDEAAALIARQGEELEAALRRLVTFEHSYREDDNRYPRDFWHVRAYLGGLDTGWSAYGQQEAAKQVEAEKLAAEAEAFDVILQAVKPLITALSTQKDAAK